MSDELIAIEEHYSDAGADYELWSRGFNMHFGFWRWGLSPFNREAMLEEMSLQVLRRLGSSELVQSIVDLGCGVGASLRSATKVFPQTELCGITIVNWQIATAKKLNHRQQQWRNILIENRDYTASHYPNDKFDAAYAIESICHDHGLNKVGVIREAHRIVKPGGCWVVADGFLKKGRVPWFLRGILRTVAHNWAVESFASLPDFKEALKNEGWLICQEEDISLRLGPTAIQTPLVCLKWLVKELTTKQAISQVRWRHVVASFLAPFIGMARPWFGYYLITCHKPQSSTE